MKRLWFPISMLSIFLVGGMACQSAVKRQKIDEKVSQKTVSDTKVSDTLSAVPYNDSVALQERDSIKSGDTVVPHAIIHHAPNQSAIDSIKKAKLKLKKRK